MEPAHPTTLEEARKAKARALAVFQPLASVVGVGVTRIGAGYGLKVNVEAQPRAGTPFPEEVDGVPVRVEVVGRPRKQ